MKNKTILILTVGIVSLGAFAFWGLPGQKASLPSQEATVPTQAAPPVESPPPEPALSPVTALTMPPVVQPRFEALLARNSDVIGWLQIPGTRVDYPVAQSLDNDYYLHRDLDRKKSEPGTLFMDFRNPKDMTGRHTIIYGHNMKDGTMFGTLRLFKKKAFYTEHRRFTYSTLYEDTQWEIFSAYVSTPTRKLILTDFADDTAFMDFITAQQKKSTFGSDVTLKPTDQVLTLITCSYEFPDARFVIHARRIEAEPAPALQTE